MPKMVVTQWDFGDLLTSAPKAAPAPARRVWTVTELTVTVRRLLEQQIGQVWVTGEITNLRAQSSGHIYFTLKDANAQVNCVLFRGELGVNRSLLQDRQKVLLRGDLTVYEPRGQYQLRVTALELQGVGALQQAFERLKQKLSAEGLFAPERKRPLPRFPQRIGLVTSPTGAAIRDVLHVVERRNPSLRIVLAPCRVQGQGAAEEIAAAIQLLNQWHAGGATSPRGAKPARTSEPSIGNTHKLDLILITRGGGSLEDLWAFNEEIVARAVFESALPVVSAVGHEIDFTISDFVADVRAATPSAAAEIITEGVFASREFLAAATARMGQLVGQRLGRSQIQWQQLHQRLARAHPRRRLEDRWQRLDDLQASLARCAKARWRELQYRCQTFHQRLLLVRPAQMITRRRQKWIEAARRLQEHARSSLLEWKNRHAQAEARLKLLSPTNVLERGYSITQDAATGKVIRAATEVSAGQTIKTRLKSGEIRSVVEE